MKNLNLNKLIKKTIILGLTTLTTLSSCGVGTLSAFTPDKNVKIGYRYQEDTEVKMVDYFNSRRAEHGITPLQIRHDFGTAQNLNQYQLAHSDHPYYTRGQVFDDGKYSWSFDYDMLWGGYDKNDSSFNPKDPSYSRYDKDFGFTYLNKAYELYHEINNVSSANSHTITILNKNMKYISCSADRFAVSCILFKDSVKRNTYVTPRTTNYNTTSTSQRYVAPKTQTPQPQPKVISHQTTPQTQVVQTQVAQPKTIKKTIVKPQVKKTTPQFYKVNSKTPVCVEDLKVLKGEK